MVPGRSFDLRRAPCGAGGGDDRRARLGGRQSGAGATVRIPSLGLSTTTSSEGRYSLIVPSTRVRGQTVDLVARHVRYNIESTPITLTGGSLIKDFELTPAGEPRADVRGAAAPTAAPADVQPVGARIVLARAIVDSTAYEEAAGPIDVVSGLAGRVAGVIVTTPSTMGGSAPIVVRGYRSIVNSVPPLFVVDGVPVENSMFATPGQAFGSGGFDYGTPVQSLNPSDIATIAVLRGPEAAALYGGRAANGVLLITTKNGRGLSGSRDLGRPAVHQRRASSSFPHSRTHMDRVWTGSSRSSTARAAGPTTPSPRIGGRRCRDRRSPQFSLTEPRKADVRPFLAFPNNISGFYSLGPHAKDRRRGAGRERPLQRALLGQSSRHARVDAVEQSGAPGRGRSSRATNSRTRFRPRSRRASIPRTDTIGRVPGSTSAIPPPSLRASAGRWTWAR